MTKRDNNARWASASFWVIMAIHAIAFTSIGLFTDRGWRLLGIFFSTLIPLVAIVWSIGLYSKKHPEKKKLAEFVKSLQMFG